MATVRRSMQSYASLMMEAQGLPAPSTKPVFHGHILPLEVEVWKPERL